MSIHNVPDEVLVDIFEFVADEEHPFDFPDTPFITPYYRKNLLPVLHTSRRFKNCAEHILWRTVSIGFYRQPDSSAVIEGLLRSLDDPCLCKYVTELGLGLKVNKRRAGNKGSELLMKLKSPRMLSITPFDLDLRDHRSLWSLRFELDFPINRSPSESARVKQKRFMALLASLYACLPNSLRVLQIEGYSTSDNMNLKKPVIREGLATGDLTKTSIFESQVPGHLAITDLQLLKVDRLMDGCLTTIMPWTRSLTKCILEMPVFGQESFDWLILALQSHKTSLRHLAIACSDFAEVDTIRNEDILGEFTLLRSLLIPADLILKPNRLATHSMSRSPIFKGLRHLPESS